MKLVSACLVGINCRYDGGNSTNERLLYLFKEYELFPVCPEQLGGLKTPRSSSEIRGGHGPDVFRLRARVLTKDGIDVTDYFIKGAYEVLKIAKRLGIKEAIFKTRSAACGCGKIYDGTFSNKLIDGDGVTTALLKKYGIEVKTDEEI
jgi:uncharacterized protein YbbK (DUF523 family)